MFLAYFSHEIRTPMSGILGFTEILLNEAENHKRVKYLNKIKNSGNDLLNIVNDILDFSKLEAGKIEIDNKSFNIVEIMTDIEEMFIDQAQSKGIDFRIELKDELCKVNLVGDPLRLKQVLINLVNNAIKFTNEGNVNVQIKRFQEKSSKQQLHFVVSDTGIGIRKEAINKLFSPFIQADSDISKRFGGTGLGLYICQHLIELMGGTIEVNSIPGEGSTFSFLLPFEINNAIQAKSPRINFSGLNCLIVDPYLISCEVISETLFRAGFENESISFSRDALDRLKAKHAANKPVDLVIINFDMPFGPNGGQMAKKIKEDPFLKETKVVLINIYEHGNEIEKYSRFIDASLKAPISKKELLRTLANIFKDNLNYGTELQKNRPDARTTKKDVIKILLAEDSKINQELISELLSNEEILLTIVENGRAALKKIATENYDLILMDINMPELDGIEASKIIRNRKENRNIPIIAITGEKEDIDFYLSSGINDYIVKPFKTKELYSKISKWTRPIRSFDYSNSKPQENLILRKFDGLRKIGVDIEDGVNRVNGKVNTYESLLKNFKSRYQNLKKEYEEAVSNKDFIVAKRLIHTIKGASGAIGAIELSKLADEFELELKNDNILRREKEASFFVLLKETLNEITQLFDDRRDKSTEEITKEQQVTIISSLKKAHEFLSRDLGIVINEMDYALEISKDTGFSGQMSNLADIVNNFDIEKAKTALEKFIIKLEKV